MVKIIGVRFRNNGKVYYFNPKEILVKTGEHVIVETSKGIEYGKVVMDPREVTEDKVVKPLKEVIRKATPEDDEKEAVHQSKEKEAYKICLQKIQEHELEMKLIEVEYAFDENKILFYFTADGRIDFRFLVKDLAAIFKTRIELRQIGVRDETKILGGIGICGRELCCRSYLSDFAPVSIRMAKEQNLSLNQTKISGVCGRLLCCLKNEQETYEELNRKLPSVGDRVVLPDGMEGQVHSVNVLRQLVKVTIEVNDEKELVEYPAEEIQLLSRKKKGKSTGEKTADQDREQIPEQMADPDEDLYREIVESEVELIPPQEKTPDRSHKKPDKKRSKGNKEKENKEKEGKEAEGSRQIPQSQEDTKKQTKNKKSGPKKPGETEAKRSNHRGKGNAGKREN